MDRAIALEPTIGSIAQSARRTITIATIAFLTLIDLFAAQAILPALAQAYDVSSAVMGLAVNACTFGMAVASIATSASGIIGM